MADIKPDPLPKAQDNTVLRPGDAEAHGPDAAALFASGQAGQTLDTLGHALTINPDDRNARLLRARIRLHGNDIDLAIEDLELLVCAPAAGASRLEMAEIWTVLGQSYLARKELVGAMLAVDVARKHEPAYPEAARLSLFLEQAKAEFEDLKED